MLYYLMIFLSIFFLYFIFRSINKNKFSFEYSQLWIFIGIIMLIFSIFDTIPSWLGKTFGFELTSNFLLFVGIIFLLIIVFIQSLQLSKQKKQIILLIQEISLIKSEERTKHDRE